VPGSLFSVALLHAAPEHQLGGAGLTSRIQGLATPPPPDGTGSAERTGNPFADMPPGTAEIFQRAMSFFAESAAASLADSYDFTGVTMLVDVGGGHGTLLASLVRRVSGLRGTLLDLPDIARRAGQIFAERGVADRCEAVGGDFFEQVPTGGDLYLLKNVIHDWNDADARTILTRCRAAMRPGSRLLLAESVRPDHFDTSLASRISARADLQMLIRGGQERSEAEYRSLLTTSGLRTVRTIPCFQEWIGMDSQLIEAVADRS
jgi:hypothetical protein